MPESAHRKPEDNTAEAISKRLAKYESKQPTQRETLDELPRWVKTALVMKEVDGLTYKEAAKRHGKAASTLASYGRSPAAQRWKKELNEWADDPINVAEAYMKGNALSVTLDRIAFLEMAIEAGDYKEGDKIARDLQDRIGITRKSSGGDQQPSLTIVLPGGSSEPQMIETEWEEADD